MLKRTEEKRDRERDRQREREEAHSSDMRHVHKWRVIKCCYNEMCLCEIFNERHFG